MFSLFKTKAISANATEELLTHPLVITEGEVIKATAASGTGYISYFYATNNKGLIWHLQNHHQLDTR